MTGTFLFRFTPSMMEHETLEAIFVQREAMAQRSVDLIRDSAITPSKHHTLFIGPRGTGKTHLISLIYHRVKAMDDLRDKLLIAWMREEEWGITSLLDLLMRVFRALVSEYNDAALNERVEALYSLPPNHIEQAAGTLLKEYAGDRALLILIENLDDIFQGLGDEGQKRLRAYIQENPFFTIAATAQGLFNGVSIQSSPFYGFFRINHLEGLSFDEAAQLLASIARYKGDRELASFIQTAMGRSRIRAVNHLAGGNHRVYVILSQFLTRESLDELVEPFMRMLDDLTPYYQDRMRWLSQQQRKIVEFLSDRRSPVTVKEIAQRCFLSHQTASSQLKILRELEYVQAESVGRESYYELREPLMRLCVEVKKNRGEPIQLFVDFLRLWYLPDELKHRLTLLQPEALLEREYVLHALKAIENEPTDPRVAACVKDYEKYRAAGDFSHALEVAEELVAIRGQAVDWILQALSLLKLERYAEMLAASNGAIKLEPDNESAWILKAVALTALKQYDEAITSSDKVAELDPDNALACRFRGVLLNLSGHYDEALVSFNKLLEFEPNEANDWNLRASALIYLKQFEEALLSYNKAIELGEQTIDVFFNRIGILLVLGKWDEGITALDEALNRFAHENDLKTSYIELLVHYLFNSARDAAIWRTRIGNLIDFCVKHNLISALGPGLVQSISILKSEMVSDAAARIWRDLWRELAGDRTEFQLPLRLLDVAVRYLEAKDQRVLLELPIEERKLIEPLMEAEEKPET
jgi:tetratricopeptide (TPR) repeat protein